MSSTSLSSSDTYGFCRYSCVLEDSYGRLINSGPHSPFYKTMGQPMVYYAEVKPHGKRPSKIKGQQRNKTPNCFVKAFKWYTQERGTIKHRDKIECPGVAGFANWLDTKYSEYLRDSSVCQVVNTPQSQQDSANLLTAGKPSRTTKRFSQMRSPWSKRTTCLCKKEDDVPCEPPLTSCEYLLQPKDLNRPASESNCQTPATGPIKSITTESTEAREAKATVKSRSMTSTCHENISSIDMTTAPEGSNRAVDKPNARSNQQYKSPNEVQQVVPKTEATQKTVEDTVQMPAKLQTRETHNDPKYEAKGDCYSQRNMQVPPSFEPIDQSKLKSKTEDEKSHNTVKSLNQESYRIQENAQPPLPSQSMETTDTKNQNDILKDEVIRRDNETFEKLCDLICFCKQEANKNNQEANKNNQEANKNNQEANKNNQEAIKSSQNKTEEVPPKLSTSETPRKREINGKLMTKQNSRSAKAEVKKVVPSKPETLDVECQCSEDATTIDVEAQCECPITVPASTSDSIHVQIQPKQSTELRSPDVKKKSIFPSLSFTRKQKPSVKVETPIQYVPNEGDNRDKIFARRTPNPNYKTVKEIPLSDICCDKCKQYRDYEETSCICPKPEQARSTKYQSTDSHIVRNPVIGTKVSRSYTILRSDAVQTSDHSIRIGNDSGPDYAFFMKIMCADKLNNCT